MNQSLEVSGDVPALLAALVKAQAGFKELVRDKHVTVKTEKGAYSFNYAPLESVYAAVLPALNANGLILSQPFGSNAEGDIELHTILAHESGGMLRSRVIVPQAGSAQKLGGELTYLKRYSVQAILGVNAEEDDDGNVAAGNMREVAQKTRPTPPTSRPAPKPAPRAPEPQPEPVPPEDVEDDTSEPEQAPERVSNPYPTYVAPENPMKVQSSTSALLGQSARARKLSLAPLTELCLKTIGIPPTQMRYEQDFQRVLKVVESRESWEGVTP